MTNADQRPEPTLDPTEPACESMRTGPTVCQSSRPRLGAALLAIHLSGCALLGSDRASTISEVTASVKAGVDDVDLERLRGVLASRVALRIHAGEVLNTDRQGRSLSVVARIYHLRDATAFLQAPYEAFQQPALDKAAAFSADVIHIREVVLTPGQRHEVTESTEPGVGVIGVVALFRTPAESRWRFAFEARASAETGITLGAHACALSVTQGSAISASEELRRVAGSRCVARSGAPPGASTPRELNRFPSRTAASPPSSTATAGPP